MVWPPPTEPDGDGVGDDRGGVLAGVDRAGEDVAQLFDIGDGRTLYLECSGEGSPLILLEAGDESGVEEWRPVFESLAAETRTCAYDRAGIGRSTEAAGCRGVDELLGDLEALLSVAGLAGPYVLVGASGGGYLMAGLAARHPADVAGLVLVETPKAITVSTLPARGRRTDRLRLADEHRASRLHRRRARRVGRPLGDRRVPDDDHLQRLRTGRAAW